MTLRRRLTLLVALAVVVPITAVGVTVVNLIRAQVEQRQIESLQQSSAFARATLAEAQEQVALATRLSVDDVERAVAAGDDALQDTLTRLVSAQELGFAYVVDPRGTILAGARNNPLFAAGVPVPTDEEVVSGRARDRALESRLPMATAELVAGQWLDSELLGGIARGEGVNLVLVDGRRVVASTAPVGALPDARLEGVFRAEMAGFDSVVAASDVPGTQMTLLTVSRRTAEATSPTNLILIFGLVLVVVVVLIVLVGYVVSGLVTGPVQDLVEAANSVARGNLEQRVDVKGDVEVAALGRAFNRMTDNLREYVHQLEQSRTEFRQAITRLGDVLVSTHDLPGIIDVVLEASALILRADVAVFYERVAMPAKLRATAAHGGEVAGAELNGSGVAGAAARHLKAVTCPGPVSLDKSEPAVSAALAVPVISEGRLFGVLAVYGRDNGATFTAEDGDTLQTLARQFEVAIGNVMLHDETKRQARTDDMTGLWNRREFELRCRDALKEAARFNNPFGIILVDIDDFKQVNDRYDHSTGDAALIWVASRLSEATREVDIVARWGGEEFTVLLPRAGVEETARVAERVRTAVASAPMRDDGKVIPLTVSIGYAVHPEDGSNANQLFRAADAGLIRAKRLGKNRVEREKRTGEGGTITALGVGR